ncbi:MAG: amidohydrolase family protein [Kordiimonas sp.]
MKNNSKPLLLSDVQVFDGLTDGLSKETDVLIIDGRVDAIGTKLEAPSHSDRLNCSGLTMMPGLIDAHFHAYASDLDFAKLEDMPDTYHSLSGSALLNAALSRGVTTVRDVGGADYGLWKGIEDGLIEGPRLFYGGRALSQTGGHGDMRGPSIEPCGCASIGRLAQIVDGEDNIRKMVREELRRGASHIKVFVSGGISSPNDPVWYQQYSSNELEAVVDEATRRGRYVAAHAYTAEAVERAIDAGIRSIEHGNLIDARVAAKVAGAGAFVVPTLSAYDTIAKYGVEQGAPASYLDKLEEVKAGGLNAIKLCKEAGVSLGFGTDLLGQLHQYQLGELLLRLEAETPYEVLKSATSTNAALLKQDGHLGCIKPRAWADFLLLDFNPLTDLKKLVSKQGKVSIFKSGKQIVSNDFLPSIPS